VKLKVPAMTRSIQTTSQIIASLQNSTSPQIPTKAPGPRPVEDKPVNIPEIVVDSRTGTVIVPSTNNSNNPPPQPDPVPSNSQNNTSLSNSQNSTSPQIPTKAPGPKPAEIKPVNNPEVIGADSNPGISLSNSQNSTSPQIPTKAPGPKPAEIKPVNNPEVIGAASNLGISLSNSQNSISPQDLINDLGPRPVEVDPNWDKLIIEGDLNTGFVIVNHGRPPSSNSSSTETPDPPVAPINQEGEGDNDDVYLAFSGGGWNSHSMLAGMIAGMLDGMHNERRNEMARRSLLRLFYNVEGISANSGGSWFLTQLAYSEPFSESFESSRELDAYNTTGFNGQTRNLFQASPSSARSLLGLNGPVGGIIWGLLPNDKKELFSIFAPRINQTGLNWNSFVKSTVYAPYGMNRELAADTLTSDRELWAKDKDIIVASAIHSFPAILSKTSTKYNVARATSSVNGMDLNVSVLPISFVSKKIPSTPSSVGPITDDALWSLKGQTNILQWDNRGRDRGNGSTVNYFQTNNRGTLVNGSSRNGIPIAQDQYRGGRPYDESGGYATTNNMGVIDATVASSSAASLLAAPRTYDLLLSGVLLTRPETLAKDITKFQVSGLLKDGAPAMRFTDQDYSRAVIELNIPHATVANQASSKYVRLADGGYADNTSVANLIRHIQDKHGITYNFEVSLFMNTSDDPVTGVQMKTDQEGRLPSSRTPFKLPADVTKLFGNSNGSHSDGLIIPGPAGLGNSPSSRIFKDDAFFRRGNDQVFPTFRYNHYDGNFSVAGYKLNVETVENRIFGIKGGQEGVLNVFVASNKASAAAPTSVSVLNAYADNFNFYRDAVTTGSNFNYFKDAFNLPVIP